MVRSTKLIGSLLAFLSLIALLSSPVLAADEEEVSTLVKEPAPAVAAVKVEEAEPSTAPADVVVAKVEPTHAPHPEPREADAAAVGTNAASNGCSSSPYQENPCGMQGSPGFYDWVDDSRDYGYIYLLVCVVCGAILFIFVIAAAITVGRKVKAQNAEKRRRIQEADEQAALKVGA